MSAPQNNFVTISRRPPDIEDYIDMVRRHRSWIVGPMFLGLVISTVVAFYWDDTYISHATMRITPQAVSERLVQNTASTQIYQRLEQITTSILSHTNLQGIITDPQLNLYAKDRAKGKALEDVAADMVKDIQFHLTGAPMDMGDHRIGSAFLVQFSYTDRFKAQKVVNKLVSMYEEQNSREQRSQARQTSSFLNEQLTTAQQKLNSAEAAITKFTVENRGHLPQEYGNNLSQLQGLRMQVSTASDQINNAQNQRIGLEAHLKDLVAQEKSVQAGAVTLLPGTFAGSSERTNQLRKLVSDLQLGLDSAQKLYRDDMPEVQHAKNRLDFAQKELEKAEKDDADRAAQTQTGPVTIKNPAATERLDTIHGEMTTVRTQIAQADSTIQRKNTQIEELTREMSVVQRAVDASGVNSQDYQRLMHDRDMAEMDVQEASKKQQASATQESLEERQAGEKLETLDMATLPETATEPKREVWAAVGTILGLLVGLVLAGAKEMKNASLKNLKDVRAYTNLPVLSSIPLLENALLVRRKRRLFWLAWTSAFIVGLVCITASMYYHFVLKAT
jgi:polysaccharide biosynthesis transport protein